MIFALFVLVLVLIVNVLAISDADKKKNFASIVKDIDAKAVIKLSPRTFKSYIDVEQRNYSLVIELTSLGGHFNCPNCRDLHNEFELTAQCYMSEYGPTSSAEFLGKPLVFGYLEYSEANVEYFRKFHLQNVPHYAVVPASSGSFQALPQYESTEIHTAEDLAGLIERATKIHVPISRPIWPQLVKGALIMTALYVSVRYIIPSLYKTPFHPLLGFAISMIVFFISIAGLVFNLIRTPPWAGTMRSGDIEYIQPGSRSQYVAEGIIIASLMTVIAFAHVGVNHIGSLRVSQQSYASRLVFWFCIGVYVLALNWLWGIFCMKYGFYPYKFFFNTPAMLKPLSYPVIPF